MTSRYALNERYSNIHEQSMSVYFLLVTPSDALISDKKTIELELTSFATSPM